MAFYIKPPSGNSRYDQLSIFGRKRMQFLHQVLDCEDMEAFHSLVQNEDTAEDSECLIEGTKKDRISHFFLRLACGNDSEMTSFLIKSETRLFCLRFASMNAKELVALLRSTYRFVHHLLRKSSHSLHYQVNIIKSAKDLHLVLNSSLGKGRTWKLLVEQYMNDDFIETISVPFQYALPLVKQREVILNHGMAFVPCAKLHQILASLFEQIVVDGVKRAKQMLRTVCEDERMVDLFRELRHVYYAGRRIGSCSPHWDLEPIRCNDIDYLEQGFPPCMQNLHRALRQKHRLRHFSRIQYTLYLKEIGMPVQEAIRFWQREYSRPPNNHNHLHSGGCDHSWSKDGKRYTYNIRHLYGLEGSRINYRAHSCYSMQNNSLGHGEEGGCPFTHFDEQHLKKQFTVANIPPEIQASIFNLIQGKKYQSACEAYFKGRLQQPHGKKWLCKREHHQIEEGKEYTSNEPDDERDNGLYEKQLSEETNARLCDENDDVEIKRRRKEKVETTSTKMKQLAMKQCDDIEVPLKSGFQNHREALQVASKIKKGSEREMNPGFRQFIVTDAASGQSGCDGVGSGGQVSGDLLVKGKQEEDEDESEDGLRGYNVDVEKPSDYYFSYMQLLRSLQSMES